MLEITKEEYEKIHNDYKGKWSSDYLHGTRWNGRKTMMHNDNGATSLLIEGIGFKIIDNPKTK